MLNKKQIKFLKSLAMRQKPIVQIGKFGVSENLYKSIYDYLHAHELIKISILSTCELTMEELIDQINLKLSTTLVTKIGKTFVLYLPSKNNIIKLP